MSIKYINRTPKPTDFKKKEIVIDGNKGNLFFKTHKNELKTLNPSDILLVSSSFSALSSSNANFSVVSSSFSVVSGSHSAVSGSYITLSSSFSAVSASFANTDAGTHFTVIPFSYTISDPTKTNDNYFIPFGTGVAQETVGLFNSYFPAFDGTLHDLKFIAYSADTGAANDLGTNTKFQITSFQDPTDLSSTAAAHTASSIVDILTGDSTQLTTGYTATGIAGKKLHTFTFNDNFSKNKQLFIRIRGVDVSTNDVLYVAGTIRMSFDYST